MFLSSDTKDRLREARFQGKTVAQALKLVSATSPSPITYQMVETYYNNQEKRGSERPHVYKSYVLGDDTEVIQEKMVKLYNMDKFQSMQQISNKLKDEMNIDVPIGVLRGIKRSLLLKDLRPIKVQHVNDLQAEKRFTLCDKWINEDQNFDRIIFSDESIFALGGSTQWITTSSPDDVDRLVGEKKFPEKVQVWATMSREGPGDLVFFDRNERLNAQSYSEILSKYLLPLVDKTYGRSNCYFMQDGASSHTARFTMEKLRAWGIQVFEWTPSSPDLNAIEFLWREIKHHLRSDARPTTRQGLEDAIDKYWSEEITKDVCNKYIDHCVDNIERVHSSLGYAIMERAHHLY